MSLLSCHTGSVWILYNVLYCGCSRSVWVSTDHDEIEKVAEAWGAKVHKRSAEVSKDCSSSLETIQEFTTKHPGRQAWEQPCVSVLMACVEVGLDYAG